MSTHAHTHTVYIIYLLKWHIRASKVAVEGKILGPEGRWLGFVLHVFLCLTLSLFALVLGSAVLEPYLSSRRKKEK